LLLVLVVVAAAVMRPRPADQPTNVVASPVPSNPPGIGARGRIEPEDGVLVVAAPYFSGRPSLIKELRVKEGDSVKAGQVLAVLDSWTTTQKVLAQREADVEVGRMRLAQVKAGSKQSDIEAQKMEIARWESEYEIATSEQRRFERLRDQQIVSPHDYDQKRLAVDRAKRTLDAARERLKSLEEIRKEDVDLRTAELASAQANVEHTRAELEQAIVRAPVNGRVLKIHTYPGEEVGTAGILELGRTARMFVVAEVYETDIRRIRIGQTARITGELVPDGLSGKVVHIGTQVTKSDLLAMDPASFADTRILKVKIQVENGERVAGLIDGKVDVVIEP
jgi:HlyD family secretion protein